MKEKKVYFPNLNGLRFIAASLVIFHHIEQIKSSLKIDNYWGQIPFIMVIGKLGVILFFVLSGFLITYLLLSEEKQFKSIGIKDFYIRRILRIWPLYFLIVFLALFVLPNIDIFIRPGYGPEVIYANLLIKILLFVLFFPNLVLSIYGVVPYASHTWSIGSEEQFYLLWPIALKYFRKHRVAVMFIIIFGYLLIRAFLSMAIINELPYMNIVRAFWATFNIDCMAIGGLYAIFLFHKGRIVRLLLNQYLFYIVLFFTLIFLLKGVQIPHFHYEFYALLFGFLILNFSANKNIKISLENKILNFLGNISYGLYMYHPIGIVLGIYLGSLFSFKSNWIFYPLSFIITIAIATVSYKYFETFFLKYKRNYSKIVSGSDAR